MRFISVLMCRRTQWKQIRAFLYHKLIIWWVKVFTRGFFFSFCYETALTHTHKPDNNIVQKTLAWILVQPSPDLQTPILSHTRKDSHTLGDKEISEEVAERDRREVWEANTTTVLISSKLDPFLSAPWKTLRLVVILCFHHPEAPCWGDGQALGVCWAPAWHQKDQEAAHQVLVFIESNQTGLC